MTIHGISSGLSFMSYVYVPNSTSEVHFPMVDLGWWVTIHDTSPGLNFVSQVYVPNSKSVVHFLMVDFLWLVTILEMVGDHPGNGG